MSYDTLFTVTFIKVSNKLSGLQKGEKNDCWLALWFWVSICRPAKGTSICPQQRVLLLHAKPHAVLFHLLHHFFAAYTMVSFYTVKNWNQSSVLVLILLNGTTTVKHDQKGETYL